MSVREVTIFTKRRERLGTFSVAGLYAERGGATDAQISLTTIFAHLPSGFLAAVGL